MRLSNTAKGDEFFNHLGPGTGVCQTVVPDTFHENICLALIRNSWQKRILEQCDYNCRLPLSPDNGSCKFLSNVGRYLPDYTALHAGRRSPSSRMSTIAPLPTFVKSGFRQWCNVHIFLFTSEYSVPMFGSSARLHNVKGPWEELNCLRVTYTRMISVTMAAISQSRTGCGV